jgi:hypothetical protein
MISHEQLDQLYALYGFTKQEDTEYAIAYCFSEGYFNNVEIIILILDDPRIDILARKYSEIQYSVRTVSHNSYDEARLSLFKGFFRIEQSNQRLLQEYKNYCKLQTSKIVPICPDFEYSYIQGDYYLDNIKEKENLIYIICDFLKRDGNRLVILEAAAGFGKTCTSYEVVKKLAEDSHSSVPLLAELSKNRKASIFKYLLLSEMDNKFTRLSYDLVTSEIRAGRVPLIIDGFDELLSKGIDEAVVQDQEDAQTMLDTIAELLSPESNAKIMLTSRKSSIFAGDAFDEWVDDRLQDSEILRVQIAEPSINNWIGHEKVDILSKNGINILNLANPVLLTILRNTKIESFCTKFKNIDDILNEYFNSLLTRESTRQDLALNVDVQYSNLKVPQSVFSENIIESNDVFL